MAGPNRPPTDRDIVQFLSGEPRFLGVITSTAAVAANNSTTAVPFNIKAVGVGFAGSLAGKVLLVQPTAIGLILPNPSQAVGSAPAVIAQQTAPPSMVL